MNSNFQTAKHQPAQWNTKPFAINQDASFFKRWKSPMCVQCMLNSFRLFKNDFPKSALRNDIINKTVKSLQGEENIDLLICILYFAKAKFESLKFVDPNVQEFVDDLNLNDELEKLMPGFDSTQDKRKELCKIMLNYLMRSGYHENFLESAFGLIMDDELLIEKIISEYEADFLRLFDLNLTDFIKYRTIHSINDNK